MPHFAVIDIETTGLSPAHHHRIVEVAVVLVDDTGTLVHEWDTLVNPERDVGACEIHGAEREVNGEADQPEVRADSPGGR